MNRTIPYSHIRDVQRVAEYEDAKRDYTGPETDCRVSANVGNLLLPQDETNEKISRTEIV